MPVYPCHRCDQLVDTHSDPYCRNCAEKKPFKCSRCEKSMNQTDIFQLERLKTKKPLFCLECGEQGEVVECGICRRTLVRSQGTQVSHLPGAKVYHNDCYNKQLGTISTLHKLTPVFGIIGAASGWFLTSTLHNTAFQVVGAVALGVLMFLIARAGSVILQPK